MKVIIQENIIDLDLIYKISPLRTYDDGSGGFYIYFLNVKDGLRINQTGLDFSKSCKYKASTEKDPLITAQIKHSIDNITNAYNELTAYWSKSPNPIPNISIKEIFPPYNEEGYDDSI